MATSSQAALGRRLLIAGLAFTVALGLGGAALMGFVSFALVDRFVLGASVVLAVTLFQAARTAYRVRRDGPDAAAVEPPPPGPTAPRDGALDAVDSFRMAERFRLLGDRYELSTLGADGSSAGEAVARIDRAAFKARERLDAYATDGQLMFTVQAQQLLDVGGRYVVTDAAGERIGELRKLFLESLVRSTWEVWDGAGSLVATVRERSALLAVTRRLIDVIPLPIPYHFDISAPNGAPIGTFRRLRTVRDRYALELPDDPGRTIDRRLALALAVALDALQGR